MKLTEPLTSVFNKQNPQPKPVLPSQQKRPSPVSLRLNAVELAALRKAAAGRSINGYIREQLFGEQSTASLSNPLSEDQEALGRLLGQLGRSEVFNTLSRLALATEEGRLHLDFELESELRTALGCVTAMRNDLVIALGLRKP